MNLFSRQLRLSVLATGAGAAACLAAAGPAAAKTVHRGSAVPGAHLVSNSTPGQQIIPVAVGPANYSVSPTSRLTFAAALAEAPAGSVIHLASGTYPAISDSVARTGWVTVTGAGDATAPVIQGAQLLGSQYLRFVSVQFSSSVVLNVSPGKTQRSPQNIALLDSTINCGSNGSLDGGARNGNTGIQVRGAAQNVTIEGDDITNCTSGFASPAQDAMSNNVSITYSTIAGVSGDAIDLGALNNVSIDHDVIGDATHPGPERGSWHNDGIQFYGNTSNVAITNNVISNSGGQLIFIQDAIKSRLTGSSVNSNILVQNNLIYGAGAYAVQDQGGENVSFIGNTIWDSHFGGLLIRQSSFTGIVPTDTTIEDNVLSGYGTQNVVPDNESNNLIYGYISPKLKSMVSSTDMLDATPDFADPSSGNFQLTGINPAVVTPTGRATATAGAGATSSTSSIPATIAPPANLGSTLVGSFGSPQFS